MSLQRATSATSTDSALRRALAWIDAHVDEFDPFNEDKPFDIRKGQKIGELAILVHAYAKITGDTRSAPIPKIVRLLRSVQDDPRFFDRLLRSPAEFILFAEVYASLRSFGHDSKRARSLIERVLAAGFDQHCERLPHRAMDVASCLQWGDFQHPFPSLQSLYATSILGTVPSALLLDEDATYALTHVIMFLYGFGSRTNTSVPEQQLPELIRLFELLLVDFCQEEHWDLLAELLLCWECVRVEPTHISDRAWKCLLAVQTEEGAVPGPTWARKLHQKVRVTSTAANEAVFYFSHHYHTTLVTVIACCLRLRGERQGYLTTPSFRPRGPSLPQLVSSAESAAGWLDAFVLSALSQVHHRPEVAAELLLGRFLCFLVTGKGDRTVSALAARVAEAYGSAGNPVDWSETRPTLKLMVAAIFEAFNITVAGLNDPTGFVRCAAETLGAMPLDGSDSELDLFDKRLLLHSLDLLPPPHLLDLSEVVTWAQSLSLDAPQAECAALLQRIECCTAFGTRAIEMLPEDAWVGRLLGALATSALRDYNILGACRILRAVIYLGLHDATIQECLDFLLLHQRPEGAFGFFGPEQHAVAHLAPEGATAQSVLNLSVTIDCMWTLLEAASQPYCRLFGKLSIINKPARS